MKLNLPQHWLDGIQSHLPPRMVPGLLRYLEDGIKPGSFLTAIIENNLKEACAMADEENKYLIWDYVNVLYNYAPSDSWGSPERMKQWIEARNKGGSCEELPTVARV